MGATQQATAQIGVHATIEDVLSNAYPSTEPEYKTLWLQQSVKERFEHDLGFSIYGLRIRYWERDDRTIWVLDEIGKEYPITFAYVVDSIINSEPNAALLETAGPKVAKGKIHSAIVMEYRESRGGEIRHNFFRTQFEGLQLQEGRLDQKIDGITGATLSVWAMEKTTKMALWLHQEALTGQ